MREQDRESLLRDSGSMHARGEQSATRRRRTASGTQSRPSTQTKSWRSGSRVGGSGATVSSRCTSRPRARDAVPASIAQHVVAVANCFVACSIMLLRSTKSMQVEGAGTRARVCVVDPVPAVRARARAGDARVDQGGRQAMMGRYDADPRGATTVRRSGLDAERDPLSQAPSAGKSTGIRSIRALKPSRTRRRPCRRLPTHVVAIRRAGHRRRRGRTVAAVRDSAQRAPGDLVHRR